jgi:hypothetical protein
MRLRMGTKGWSESGPEEVIRAHSYGLRRVSDVLNLYIYIYIYMRVSDVLHRLMLV